MAMIVLFEDEALQRTALENLLTNAGYNVQAYRDPALAMDVVDFAKVDLVITDLAMKTSGKVAVYTLRQCGFRRPIIVLSGYVGPGIATRLKALGVDVIIEKPIDPLELIRLIQCSLSSPCG